MDLRFLVVGTGRCGTVYFAKLLSSLGIPCGHESVFTPFGLSHALPVLDGHIQPLLSHCSRHDWQTEKKLNDWVAGPIVADSSYMAAPFLNDERFRNIPVVHLVRSPIQVVSSFVLGLQYFQKSDVTKGDCCDLYQHFIHTHLPMLKKQMNPVTRGCAYYVGWNNMIREAASNRPYFLHRLEDGVTADLLRFLGVRYGISLKEKSNALKHDSISLNDIECPIVKAKFTKMIKRFGYEPTVNVKFI